MYDVKPNIFFEENSIVKRFICLVTPLLFLTACGFLPKEEEILAPPLMDQVKVEYETSEVTRGEIIHRISGVGNLRPINISNFYFSNQGGNIKQIHIRPGDVVEEGDLLVELETGTLEFELKMIDIELEKAQLQLGRVRNDDADSFTINMAMLDVKSTEIRRDHYREQLEKSRLRATISGIVTYATELEEGELVDRFQTLVQVADPHQLFIIYTATTENNISGVDLGMEVRLNYEGEELTGKVIQTPRHITQTTSQGNSNIYSRSILIDLLDEPLTGMEIGDRVDIEVITQQRENTLIIPRGALRSFMGREYVQVLEDNDNIREIDIETGIITSREVEVLTGLKEGDKVILR